MNIRDIKALDALRDTVNPARQYLYNALTATNEEQQLYWCKRFVRAIRPVLEKKKIRYRFYGEKVIRIRPANEIISERSNQ